MYINLFSCQSGMFGDLRCYIISNFVDHRGDIVPICDGQYKIYDSLRFPNLYVHSHSGRWSSNKLSQRASDRTFTQTGNPFNLLCGHHCN